MAKCNVGEMTINNINDFIPNSYILKNGKGVIHLIFTDSVDLPDVCFTCTINIKIASKAKKIRFKKMIFTADVELRNIEYTGSIEANGSTNLTVRDCSVTFFNCDDCIWCFKISKTKNIRFENVSFKDGRSIGIFVEESSGSFEKCGHLSQSSGFLYVKKSELIIHKSKIETSKIAIHCEHSTVTTTDCSFSKCTPYCIEATQVNLTIKDTTFDDVEDNAVSLTDCCSTLFDNVIFKQIKNTCILSVKSKFTVIGSKFYKIGGNGIFSKLFSETEIERCDFDEFDFPSVAIIKFSRCSCKNSNFRSVKQRAFVLRQYASGSVENCSFTKASKSALSFSDSHDIYIRNNIFLDIESAVCECYNKSSATFEGNLCKDCHGVVFDIFNYGNMRIISNRIENSDCVIRCVYGGGFFFKDNCLDNIDKPYHSLSAGDQTFICDSGNSWTNVKSNSTMYKISYQERCKCDWNGLCLRCGKNPVHDIYLDSCGHRVLCRDCVEEASKNEELCPMCSFPISGYITPFLVERVCGLCVEKDADSIHLPCGHIFSCFDCSRENMKVNAKCPVCRKSDISIKRLTTTSF